MDIPACTSADGSISPPPSYNEIIEFPLYEEIPTTPPPPYKERDTVQESSQNNRANPFPVLNVPTQTTMVNHSQQVFMQQTVSNVAPQVVVVQPERRIATLGDTPTVTVCPYCHTNIITKVDYKPGGAAWGMCCLLTVLGLICGFCLIPFFVRGFQDAHHSCPNCHNHLGIYVRK